LITQIILGKAYNLCLPQPPAISSLSDPNILLSTLFSNPLYLCSYNAIISKHKSWLHTITRNI
jgi:hypothetical protein